MSNNRDFGTTDHDTSNQNDAHDRVGDRYPDSGPRAPVSEAVNRVIRNSTLNLAGQGVYAVLYLVIIAGLARGLGKGSFGAYYALFALMLVVQVVCEAGVSTVLTRRLVRSDGVWRPIAVEAAWLFGGIIVISAGTFVALGTVWCWWHNDASLWNSFALMGVACAGVQLQRYCTAVFGAFERFRFENAARLLQGATFATLLIILLVLGTANLESVLAFFAASHVAAAMLLVFCLSQTWSSLDDRLSTSYQITPIGPPTRARVWHWLSESVPLGFGDVLRGTCWQIDTILLSILQPAAIVGIYSIAYRPLGPINWVPLSILTAVFPSFARMADANRGELQGAFSVSIRLLWIASLPIGVFFCVCAEPVILLLAGSEFLEAAQPLRVIIWLTALTFVSYPFRYLFTALGRSHLYAALVLLMLGVQVGLAVTLIPLWGYWGACAGSFVAEGLFTVLGLVLCRRLGLRNIPWQSLGAAAVAAVVMAALLWPARMCSLPVLALAVAGAFAAYVGLCVLLGALRRAEVMHFAGALGWKTKLARRVE